MRRRLGKSYRHPSGRIIARDAKGRFTKLSFNDLDGAAEGKMKCAQCGHIWRPLLKTGICPKCGCKEKAPIEPNERQKKLIKRYREMRKELRLDQSFIDPVFFRQNEDKFREFECLKEKLKQDGLL